MWRWIFKTVLKHYSGLFRWVWGWIPIFLSFSSIVGIFVILSTLKKYSNFTRKMVDCFRRGVGGLPHTSLSRGTIWWTINFLCIITRQEESHRFIAYVITLPVQGFLLTWCRCVGLERFLPRFILSSPWKRISQKGRLSAVDHYDWQVQCSFFNSW